MPIVQKPGEASFTVIPFEPDFIAQLMLRGYNVFPDDGINPDLFLEQEKLVQSAFDVLKARKDWGEHKLAPEIKRWKAAPQPPSTREDAPLLERLPPLKSTDYLNVKPNPFVTDNMLEVDPNRLMNRKLFPDALISYEL